MNTNPPTSGDDARMAELLSLAVADVTPGERRPADAALARADRWRWLHGLRGVFVALLSIGLVGGGAAVAASQLRNDDSGVTVAPAPTVERTPVPTAGPLLTPTCPYDTSVPTPRPTWPTAAEVPARGEPLPLSMLPTAAELGAGWTMRTAAAVDELPFTQDYPFDVFIPTGARAEQRSLTARYDLAGGEPGWYATFSVVRYDADAVDDVFRTLGDAQLGCAQGSSQRAIARDPDRVVVQADATCGVCTPERDTSFHAVARVGNVIGTANIEMSHGHLSLADADRIAQGYTDVLVSRLRGASPAAPPALAFPTPTPAPVLMQTADLPNGWHVGNSPSDARGPPPLKAELAGCDTVLSGSSSGEVAQVYRDAGNDAIQEAVYHLGEAGAAAVMADLRRCGAVTSVPGMPTAVIFSDPSTVDNFQPVPGAVVQVGGDLIRLRVVEFYGDGKDKADLTRTVAALVPPAAARAATGS